MGSPSAGLWIWILIASFLAGCVGAPAETSTGGMGEAPTAGNEASPGGDAASASEEGEEDVSSAPAEPVTFEVYLTAGRGLVVGSPDGEGVVEETANLFAPEFQAGAGALPPWTTDAGVEGGFRLLSMRLDLFFSSETPQRELSSAAGFKPVVVWFGEEGRWSPTLQMDAPAVLSPGEVAHATGEFPIPAGGYVYEKGALPAIRVAFGYEQAEGNPILVHVGGEQGSRLTVTTLPHEMPPGTLARGEETHPGSFTYNSYFAENPDEAERLQEFPVVVTASTVKVEADLTGSSSAGHMDLDLELLPPSGERVWASTSPFATEGLALYDVNLRERGPGEYRLRVTNWQSIQGEFTLTVQVHDLPVEE